MDHSGWSRIRAIDATHGWVLSGPATEHWLTKPFPGGRAVIRVIAADGTLRVTLGDDSGRLVCACTETTGDIGRAKAIAQAAIVRRRTEASQA
ncbi:hypothetical protein IU486_04900 [Streptomyces gardneri]|uniref:hypothetical protein n=1 Tax=Nocardia TaxID=1817 RepID=UPI0013577EE8|nr:MULTISPECIES: hypothetical protein [Nocardia]MBF6164114.1 hypothetical protein [Streptomyces gardneri]MBF6203688.1 hypothetical protein [Streptomyces gardneri]